MTSTRDKKKIKYIADDYGYHYKSSKKIQKLFKEGKIKSFSILSNFLASRKNKDKFLKAKRGILHFNLDEGYPISESKEIKSLVGKNNKFHSRYIFLLHLLMGLINKDEVSKELEAQFKYLKKLGTKVTEVNSHEHIHAFSPVAEIIDKFAKKEKLKIRCYGDFQPKTLWARMVLIGMKLFARLTHLIYFREWRLPASWKSRGESFTFLSLETEAPINSDRIVIHPDLGFDKNKTYEKSFTED